MIDYVTIVLLKVEKSSYVESILYICCRGCCGAISDELVQQRKVWPFWGRGFHYLGHIWVRLLFPVRRECLIPFMILIVQFS